MSDINTNSINANYPTPGVNNSTQGFRDNFTGIKLGLNQAGTEITDLQNKVIVKSALTGIPLNNDMANTLISNAAVRGFRATTYNVSASAPASITIDVTKADVQYCTIIQNTAISFGGWSPAGTASSVTLILNISQDTPGAANSYITLPTTTLNSSNVVTTGMNLSSRLLENYYSNIADSGVVANAVYTNMVSVPTGARQLSFTFSTIDCGATIDVQPDNRNQKASQITRRTPTAVGARGDAPGTICADNSYMYVCVGTYDGTTNIWGKIALTAV
jgi:hypothetical protein